MGNFERVIKEYLKQNLRIEVEESTDYMETTKFFNVKLLIDDDEISSDRIELPNR